MQERAETLLKAMKVEKSLLEVPRVTPFLLERCSFLGSWKLWKLNEAEGGNLFCPLMRW